MRGKGKVDVAQGVQVGITPAHAGKRRHWASATAGSTDHPRACGEKPILDLVSFYDTGSPPRMRGKATPAARKVLSTGITPAHAGKRTAAKILDAAQKDHPRACGEKETKDISAHHRIGSPPRMRGKVRPRE